MPSEDCGRCRGLGWIFLPGIRVAPCPGCGGLLGGEHGDD